MTSRIFRSFLRHNVVYVVLTFLVALTFSAVFSSFVVSTDINRALAVSDIKDQYGDYDVILAVDPARVPALRDAPFVRSVSTFLERVDPGSAAIFCDRPVFDTLGLKMLVGEFPAAPGSVMIEQSTALKTLQFTRYEDVIGQAVSVGGTPSTVSGIYYAAMPLYANVYIFGPGDSTGATQWVAVSYRDTGNVEGTMPELLRVAGLPASAAEQVFANIPLMATMGYGEDGRRSAVTYTLLLVVLLTVLLTMSGLILGNVFSLMIDRNLKAFGVFKALRASIRPLVWHLLIPVYAAVVVGVAGGFAASYYLVGQILFHGQVGMAVQPETPFPARAALVVVLVLVATYSLIALAQFRRVAALPPIAVLKASRLASTRPPARARTLLDGGSVLLSRFRVFRSMVGSGLGKGLVVVLGISLVVIVNVSMANFWAVPRPMSTMRYDYVLTPQPTGDPSPGERVLVLLRQESDAVTVYDSWSWVSSLTVPKEALTPEASRALTQSAQFRNRMRETVTAKVTLPTLVLGYDQAEMRLLAPGQSAPGDDECIVFQRSLSKFGVERLFDNEPVLTLRYDVSSPGELSHPVGALLGARYSTDTLLFPVDAPDYAVIIIVRLDRFQQMFPETPPATHYLVMNPALPTAKDRVLGVISGTGSFELTDMQRINADQAANESLARLLFGFFIVVTALFSIVNTFALFALKLRSDADRYSSYLILGIRRGHIMAAFAAETGLYYVVGLAVSYVGLLAGIAVVNAILPMLGVSYAASISIPLWLVFQGGLLAVLLAVLVWVFRAIGRLRANPHTIVVE